MAKVKFYDAVADDLLGFVVIAARTRVRINNRRCCSHNFNFFVIYNKLNIAKRNVCIS